jgi:hypothetical protein
MSSSPIAVLLLHKPTTSTPPAAVTDREQPALLNVLAAVVSNASSTVSALRARREE